jgi:hypothetical protein
MKFGVTALIKLFRNYDFRKCIYPWLYKPSVGPWSFFQFFNPIHIDRTPWTGDQPFARPLLTHRTAQTLNKRRQTTMP